VKALVKRKSQTTKGEDQKEKIENHSGSLGGFSHRGRQTQIVESAQIRATFAVPGDQESAALQPEQVPWINCEIELKAITTRVHSEPLIRFSFLQVGQGTYSAVPGRRSIRCIAGYHGQYWRKEPRSAMYDGNEFR